MAQATQRPRTRGEKFRAECIRWMTAFDPDLFVTFVYIATVEKPQANIHIHALFKMTAIQKMRFYLVADEIWEKLAEAGNLDIQPVSYAEGVADYITKELRPETSDRLLLPRHKERASTR